MEVINGVLTDVQDEDIELLKVNPDKFWKGVTIIGEYAFQNCENLTSVTIPSSITEIGDSAFYRCENLSNIIIPNSVTKIDNYAFYHCENLTSITIPNSVTQIGFSAFSDCKNLTSIAIPNSVTEIGDSAFFNCENLSNIIIPNSVTEISDETFRGCKNLTSIAIPNSVTEIDNYAFDGCENLTSITIPNSVTEIGEGTFRGCNNLTSITIPNSVTKICNETFSGCKNLTSIAIPNSVIKIGSGAFRDCKNLTSIIIPDSVTYISSGAFSGCENLNSITIPNSVTEIGDYAFSGCKNLTSIDIPDSVTYIGSGAFSGCENLNSITIPNSVTKIGDSAFSRCENLTSITIPNSVTKIGDSAFTWCPKLKEIIAKGKSYPYNPELEPQYYTDPEKYSKFVSNHIPMKNVGEMERKGLIETKEDNETADFNFKQYNILYKKFKGEDEKGSANLHDLVNLGLCLGLFSNDTIKLRTANGKMRDMKVSELAYNVLQKVLSDAIPIREMHSHFYALHSNNPNLEFLMFLSNKTNLSEILNEEKNSSGFITRTFEWFQSRKNYDLNEAKPGMPTSEEDRYKVQVFSTSADGVDRLHWQVPTVTNLKEDFANTKFENVTPETREIAHALGTQSNYTQRHFDKAVEISEEFKKSGTPKSLVKRKVKQNIDDSWKQYFAETEKLRGEIADVANEVVANQASVANKIFTYELLDKDDPQFYNIGFLTSCCAVLYGAGAGAQRATILSPDMQALAIRDARGNITAFSIIYLNRAEQYAVLNDIEVNKIHANNPEELDAIYRSVEDGVRAFVEEYDREEDEHANAEKGYSPKYIKKVTCGISPNWRGGINDRIRKNPEGKVLPAPDFNDWKYNGSGSWSGDWHRSQWLIYDRNKELEEKYEK